MSVTLAGGVRHPKVYLYTTDAEKDTPWQGPREGKGLVKVGYTERDVHARVQEQLNPVKQPTRVEPAWVKAEAAITTEGLVFRDHEVHQALVKAGVHRREGEWFEATPEEVLAAIDAVKKSTVVDFRQKADFGMRAEQARVVEETVAYFDAKAGDGRAPHFLWNAKMRFGKTFTAYKLAQQMGWKRILVLTYKPAVVSAWRDDLLGHVDFEGWRFHTKDDDPADLDDPSPLVWFASFQDVLGKDENGAPKAKNLGLYEVDWDAVIIDEYHFGAWRDAARSLYLPDADTGSEGDASEKAALDNPDLDEDFATALEDAMPLRVAHYLYLSGTPFRALTQGQFLEDAVANWTYSDEQREKAAWKGKPEDNPYAALPKMHLLAYEMPEALKEVARNNAAEFSLTEFFRTRKKDGVPRFIHENEVQKWLDLLRGQDISGLWSSVSNQARPPLPYEDTNLLRALQHTIWYLPSVDACYAMRNLLEAQQNVFYRDYTVVVAAGNDAGMGEKALPPVLEAIGPVPQDTKSITLTCAKLMTGVTVPAWTGILMLQEIKSPESYFQAAFRVQSPWTSKLLDSTQGGEREVVHKEQCYVLDFSPNRALRQIVDYATRLRSETTATRDDETAIQEFMEFLPVLSFDGSSMAVLQAGDVLNYLMTGMTGSALARRWNSPELITLDLKAMELLLANPELLASLEQIEKFSTITNDLTAMISTNKELRQKTLSKEKLTKDEVKKKTDAAKRRASLKENLQSFVARIPLFMYLTDDREKAVRDIITQVEPDLFQKVTGLTISDFDQLLQAKVFDDRRMDDAVWKFRDFETPSLSYDENAVPLKTVGGWVLRRDDRLAQLIDQGVLEPGGTLTGPGDAVGVVTDDYGIAVGGIRYDTPDDAAAAASGQLGTSGWEFWTTETPYGSGTLAELHTLVSA